MIYVLALLTCLFTVVCFGQDLIYKKDKSILRVKIVEIGPENVTYRDFYNQHGPILITPKYDIIKIRTESGKEIQIEPLGSTDFYHKNMIKSDIFSYATSKITIGYERSYRPNRTYEFQLGIIGIGAIPEDISELGGAFLRFGIKFKRSPEHYSNKGKNTNYFKGGYFKPELVVGGFTEQRQTFTYNAYWYNPYYYSKRSVAFSSLIANIGYQWTIGDNVAFDYYMGVGIGPKSKDDSNYKGWNYAVVTAEYISMQMGFKLGVMF
jgi:hypothetical protein